MELVTASTAGWSPARAYDLITCVHGLHYLGDKLALLARAASWLTPDGLLSAGRAAGTRRAVGRRLRLHARPHRLTLCGGRSVTVSFDYLGADADAGPSHTGRPAVASYYRPSGRPYR